MKNQKIHCNIIFDLMCRQTHIQTTIILCPTQRVLIYVYLVYVSNKLHVHVHVLYIIHYSPNKLTNSKANNALCVAVCTTIIITDIYWWYKHNQTRFDIHEVVIMMNLLILPLLRGLQKPENLLLSISVIKQENSIIINLYLCYFTLWWLHTV